MCASQQRGEMIAVDTNAGEDAGCAAMQDVQAERRRLDVGDILVQGEDLSVCIERKTWPDLCASICDGRLQEQKSRMLRDERTRYVYAVEGAEVEAWDGFHRGMRQKCMWGALVKMQMRDDIAVFHTRSPQDTAALAMYIAQQLREGGFRAGGGSEAVAGVQKRKRDNLADPAAVLRAMLTVIPGMSAAKAEVLLRAYPTVSKLVAATPTEIATQSCGARAIGPKLATAVKAVFFATP